ncbi:HEAT repeat domain-containing protein [Pelatocladus sp. BLCC-F211]|uniref:HEAT repeat domain-containing protein n=1 Tax=Pelatocladus sp. BLCC-F211 TaxID=3342752 RepID=UPI0035B6B22F
MKNHTIYQPPVEKLLTLGDCHKITNEYNYTAELGLDTEHIPDLIRMAIDQRFNGADSGSLEMWGPIHAWRALGQLGAEVAIEPLIQLFHELEDSDWVNEEMPKVYGRFGEIAIPRLQAYLADESHGIFPRITAIHCLEEICKQHPDTRQKCITVLTQQLKLFAHNPQEINGFLVASLIELQAVESATVIKSAFVGQSVPDEITGSWDDVCQILDINSDEIALFTDISLDGVSQLDNFSVDDIKQTEDISQMQELAANEKAQLEDNSVGDVTHTEDTSQMQELAANEKAQLEDNFVDDIKQTEDISQTQEITASEELQPEDTSVDDIKQTEDISQTQEITASEELQLEDTSVDNIKQTEDISQTQDFAVDEKQSDKITTEEVEKNLAVTSHDIQLFEDASTDVEKLQKLEDKNTEQKQSNDINNSETEANQFKSELDNTVLTESLEQPSSKGFGGFGISQGKAKTKKKKKR